MTDFDFVESLFARLLCALKEKFSDEEIAEVSDFVNVGEYGIALDTVVDIFIEEKKSADLIVTLLVNDLARAMNLDQEKYTARLQRNVPD